MILLTTWNLIAALYLLYIVRQNNTTLLNLTPHISNNIASASSLYNKYSPTLSAKWLPLFKRSSYIGLVWKSNWKL